MPTNLITVKNIISAIEVVLIFAVIIVLIKLNGNQWKDGLTSIVILLVWVIFFAIWIFSI